MKRRTHEKVIDMIFNLHAKKQIRKERKSSNTKILALKGILSLCETQIIRSPMVDNKIG
jgi:hypothetical protein